MINFFKLLQKCIWISLSLMLFSCEGFKFIAVHNESKDTVVLFVQPGVEKPVLGRPFKNYRSKIDTILSIPPDSTLLLANYFGPLFIFNERIREKEIKYHYLKIISKTDTIIAKNRNEIFKLLDRKRNVGTINVK